MQKQNKLTSLKLFLTLIIHIYYTNSILIVQVLCNIVLNVEYRTNSLIYAWILTRFHRGINL